MEVHDSPCVLTRLSLFVAEFSCGAGVGTVGPGSQAGKSTSFGARPPAAGVGGDSLLSVLPSKLPSPNQTNWNCKGPQKSVLLRFCERVIIFCDQDILTFRVTFLTQSQVERGQHLHRMGGRGLIREGPGRGQRCR